MKNHLEITWAEPEGLKEERPLATLVNIYPAQHVPRMGEEILVYEGDPLKGAPVVYIEVTKVRTVLFVDNEKQDSGIIKVSIVGKFIRRETF